MLILVQTTTKQKYVHECIHFYKNDTDYICIYEINTLLRN